ncbi:hypothetical protein ACOME3_003901 [Neoechinorhynchus agilis]
MKISLFFPICFFIKDVLLGPIERCIWYGENKDKLNFVDYSVPRRISNQTLVKKLLSVCPHFNKSRTENGILSCCDADQIETIVSKIRTLSYATLYKSKCLDSVYLFICGISCDYRQASYMRVSQKKKINGKDVVSAVDLLVSKAVEDELYSSCTGTPIGFFDILSVLTSTKVGAPASFNTTVIIESEYFEDHFNGLVPYRRNLSSNPTNKRTFCKIGLICSNHPVKTILSALLLLAIMCAGNACFEATSDPVELWAMKGSISLREKEYYDEHFGPFYRSCQLYLMPKSSNDSLFRQEHFKYLHKVENDIVRLIAGKDRSQTNLSMICFKPMKNDDDGCMIISPVQYFDSNLKALNDYNNWSTHLLNCMKLPFNKECMPKSGIIVNPSDVIGDYRREKPSDLNALILTILLRNPRNGKRIELDRVKAWESEFLRYVKSLRHENLTFAFSAGRSIEDEVDQASKADLNTVVLSYAVMFAYLSVFLGSFQSIRTFFVHSRILLGIGVLFTIFISVLSSFGFYSYLGFKTSVIVLEVTPFLLLAVSSGDNFIFVKNYMRKFNSDVSISVEQRVAANLGEIGPSLLLSSCSQALTFGIGAAIPVGAIRVFALYSCLAVVIKFILQITMFVSMFTLDCKRQNDSRYELICCLKTESKPNKHRKGNIVNLKQPIAFCS